MQAGGLTEEQKLSQLQTAIEQLQASISQHSQLLTATANPDPRLILNYAHKIAYTSFAPVGHQPGQPLPQNFRPPNPQEWQLRASQLHQYQAECNQRKLDAQAAAQAPPVELSQEPAAAAAVQLPPGMKLPPMPKGWKPGMPIPGLEELLAADLNGLPPAAFPAEALAVETAQQLPTAAPRTANQPAATTQPVANDRPVSEADPALRPRPVIPDFVLNPGLEVVEEEFSSSDYSDDEEI